MSGNFFSNSLCKCHLNCFYSSWFTGKFFYGSNFHFLKINWLPSDLILSINSPFSFDLELCQIVLFSVLTKISQQSNLFVKLATRQLIRESLRSPPSTSAKNIQSNSASCQVEMSFSCEQNL